MNRIRLALAQIDSTVGDFDGNSALIAAGIARAKEAAAHLVAFPELSLTGYPPEDLTFNPDFIAANQRAVEELIPLTGGLTAIVGCLEREGNIYNSAAIIVDRQLKGFCRKTRLPNYGVFDEFRYFARGELPTILDLDGRMVGVSICEDIWYPDEPLGSQAAAGADLFINISASPYRVGRTRTREEMLETRARDFLTPVAMVNLVGGQDELVFDGNSLVYGVEGELLARGRSLEEDLIIVDVDIDEVRSHRRRDDLGSRDHLRQLHPGPVAVIGCSSPETLEERERRALALPPHLPEPLEGVAEVYRALVLGIADYTGKNGFSDVVIGLSGGVDSALTAALAHDALGQDRVHGISMPSRYSSEGTRSDAAELARRLGIGFREISIEPLFKGFLELLAPEFAGAEPDQTEENLQARIRGNIIMALSNKFGWLVLTTGNKSEGSVGYATLYGDMAGGFAVIKDVPKTMVYDLCRYRNSLGEEVIPASVIEREPSAELAPDQRDQDTLPPYDVLDRIIELYVEHDKGLDEIAAGGIDPQTVRRVTSMIDRNEYKRRQAPPGIKITSRAFGKDRRFPITNRFGI
ncbi:MAG: NAD+ synthase [Thermoleophilia bacterium]